MADHIVQPTQTTTDFRRLLVSVSEMERLLHYAREAAQLMAACQVVWNHAGGDHSLLSDACKTHGLATERLARVISQLQSMAPEFRSVRGDFEVVRYSPIKDASDARDAWTDLQEMIADAKRDMERGDDGGVAIWLLDEAAPQLAALGDWYRRKA